MQFVGSNMRKGTIEIFCDAKSANPRARQVGHLMASDRRNAPWPLPPLNIQLDLRSTGFSRGRRRPSRGCESKPAAKTCLFYGLTHSKCNHNLNTK